MTIDILYEDAEVLVINKPAGLIVHADGRTNEPSVVDWILEKYPNIKSVGEHGDVLRSGIVHRLDRETSGVMVIAKNPRAFEYLKKQFQERKVEKIYHAFVYGRVNPPAGGDEGVIDRPIARSKHAGSLWSAMRGRKGKEREAVTEYRILQRGAAVSLLELRPKTGRTHQIRVHLKAINYPVVCDKLYAFTRRSPARPAGGLGEGGPKREYLPAGKAGLLGFSRLALHARSLSLALPSGKELHIEAPYPEDFKAALSLIGHAI